VAHVRPLRQIGASAEGSIPGAREDHQAQRRIRLQLGADLPEAPQHRPGQGVAALRAVQRHQRDVLEALTAHEIRSRWRHRPVRFAPFLAVFLVALLAVPLRGVAARAVFLALLLAAAFLAAVFLAGAFLVDVLAVVALRGVAARGVFSAVALRGVLAVVAPLAVFLVAFCGDFPRLRAPSSVPACSSLVSRVWSSFSWPRSFSVSSRRLRTSFFPSPPRAARAVRARRITRPSSSRSRSSRRAPAALGSPSSS